MTPEVETRMDNFAKDGSNHFLPSKTAGDGVAYSERPAALSLEANP